MAGFTALVSILMGAGFAVLVIVFRAYAGKSSAQRDDAP
jgi:hypothetical protein